MVFFAQISDIHIDGKARSVERAERVVRYIAGLPMPVDAVLVTGDVADHGAEAEYERVHEILDLPMPVLFCPGNHDARESFRKVLLGAAPDGAPINSAYRVGGALFAMCDSSVPGRGDGLLADETLSWLDSELSAAADLPAFVCFHHPPVILGAPYVDGIRQFAEERLAALIAQHPSVVALLCGHAHTPAASIFAGKPLLVAPGVVSTSLLPFEGTAIVELESPPMLALHILHEDRRLTTHYRVAP